MRPFSSRRIKSLIVTSLFAIAVAEIRTGRISREKADYKLSTPCVASNGTCYVLIKKNSGV